MKRFVKTRQRLVTQLYVEVDGSAVAGGSLTTDGLLHESEHVKITENGDGDYTITLNEPGSRACQVMACSKTDATGVYVAAATASTVQVIQTGADQTTPVADGDFYVIITKFDSSDQT